LKTDYQKEKRNAQIKDLDAFLKLNLIEEHRKSTGKYGRELLLYGPPGTCNHQTLVMHV
jgi:hypothetical protein